ncbi:MAG: YihY/virulence factor BrkB family protein [Actinobacteria bacterium]|nr:YihY/virulence factor BrkB family protein [Actinomycetota bacterium]
MAFFAMLGLFPALVASAAVLGSLDGLVGRELAAEAELAVLGFLDRVFTDDANGVLEAVRSLFTERKTGLLTLGLLTAVLAATRSFFGALRALEVAYDLEPSPIRQSALIAVLLAVGSVGILVVMLTLLILGPLLGSSQEVADALGQRGLFTFAWRVLRPPLAFAALVAWAVTVLHVASRGSRANGLPWWSLRGWRRGWRSHIPGGLLTGVWWLAVSFAFRLYLDLASGTNPVFGVLGGAMILLLWLYLLSTGLLLGGELNAVLARRRR